MKTKKTFDSIITGIIPGLIIPIITVYFFYLFRNYNQGFDIYIKQIIKHKLITKVLSVCLISNLAIFFLFLKTNRYKSARGVILATIIYALFTVIYIFFIN